MVLEDVWRIVYHPAHPTGIFGTGPLSEPYWTVVMSPDGNWNRHATLESALQAWGIQEPEFAEALTQLGTELDRISGLVGELRWMAYFTENYTAQWCFGATPMEAVQKALNRDDSIDEAYVQQSIEAKNTIIG